MSRKNDTKEAASNHTRKQEMFCKEYLVDLNATQAAIRAGYSEKTAMEQGYQLLQKTSVKANIQKLMDERAERVQVTADMVLNELRKIGFADIRKAVKWGINPQDTTSEHAAPNGLNIYPVSLVPSELIDDDTVAAVSEVSLTQTGIKVKMHDKLAALEKLGKHLKLFTDKTEHSGSVDVILRENDTVALEHQKMRWIEQGKREALAVKKEGA